MEPAIRGGGSEPIFSLRDVTLGYGGRTIQHGLSFDIRRGSIFALVGESGAGKSTVLRSMVGLLRPRSGTVLFTGESYWGADARNRARIGQRFGVLFQSGALWSSLTVGENVALPMQMFTQMDEDMIRRFVDLKLALVGLEDAAHLLPAQLSGGMAKRAGLARALALDADVLFLDEPSSGLDPVAARRLDDLILDLRDALGSTVVLVSHDLPSLFAVADDGIFLDAKSRTVLARGSPAELRDHSGDPTIRAFMNRAEVRSSGAGVEETRWQTLGWR
jgi:phospholipid/cholesterol/gamma-HCH transport system ATP-binding protein